MTGKPPVPARMLDPWPRIDVDTTDRDFEVIARNAVSSATGWVLGPDGPYKKSQTMVEIIDHAVREGLLHLFELGLIDIDTERLHACKGVPTRRERPHQP